MITIIGAGKFGQAVSKLLGNNKHQLVDVEPDGSYSKTTVEKIKEADHLIICVPSAFLESCCKMNKENINPKAKLLSCVKGIYDDLKTPTEIIRNNLHNPLATFNGPNLSAEIMLGRPAMATIAGDDAKSWIPLFKSKNFAVEEENDRVGAEFGSAAKNIIALGAGLIDGYYGGDACNTMGTFVTFSVRELETLYHHRSKSPLPRLSFLGDLFATGMSEASRNHQFGHLCGVALREGRALPKPEGTVEGYRTLMVVMNYLEKHKMSLPNIEALYGIFTKQDTMDQLIESWSR